MKYLLISIACLSILGCSKEDLDPANLTESFYVRNDGADMPVHMRGNIASEVVILVVHGGPGGSGLEYRPGKWTADLEEKYAMAYWDQRGQGMSHGKQGGEQINVSQMVEDLNAVVATIKAKYGDNISVFALGHSWGGLLSAQYVVTDDYQHNLNGWIESNGAHDLPRLNESAVYMFRDVAQQQINLGNRVSDWQGALDWANALDPNNISSEESGEINQKGGEVEGWLGEDGFIGSSGPGGNQSSFFSDPLNPLTSTTIGNQTNGALNDEIEATALTSELSKVTIPSLFLWGRYDFIVPPQLGFDALGAVSSDWKRLVIFEASGHSPMDNQTSLYVSEIEQFIELHR